MHETTRKVRDMYTRFPYPPRGLDSREGEPAGAVLDLTRHVFWPGRSNLAGLRVLDAGCGTGRTAVSIARNYPDIQVVGIDLSETSLDRARSMADAAGVGDNLQLRMLPIEDIGTLGQQFDYIISSGVIHHLESPERGLRALTEVLAPTGGMFLMVYATYGRAGVYMLQDAIRLLGAGADYPELLELARPLMTNLPAEHPFHALHWVEAGLGEDAGIVDLLLHVRDRSFTVPQLFELVELAGLRVSRFMDPMTYEPATYVPELSERFNQLDSRTRAEVAELLSGRMCKHCVYLTHVGNAPFRPVPSGLVLLALRPRRSPMFNWGAIETIGKKRHQQFRLTEWAFNETYTRDFDFAPWQMSVVRECDGVRTAMDVFNLPEIQQVVPGDDRDQKLHRFGAFLEVLAITEVILCEG